MRRAAPFVGLLGLAATIAAAEPPPAEDYVLHCSGCHRQDGAGVPGVVPPLTGLGPLLHMKGGRDYVGRVPGVAQSPLADDRLAALLNWVARELSDAGPFAPYSAAEVHALRQHPLRDPQVEKQRILAQGARIANEPKIGPGTPDATTSMAR